jgi:hypothetical protein
LSPDNTILATMIEPSAAHHAAEKRTSSMLFLFLRPHSFQRLGAMRRNASRFVEDDSRKGFCLQTRSETPYC